ncbi:MAG: hypothetical protein M1840_007247 [Geoglossum simile]|nr:MAG: hypothetical protein M1840_007247 [Geoglossum simile]
MAVSVLRKCMTCCLCFDSGTTIPDLLKDDPLGPITIVDLRTYVTKLHDDHFKDKSSVTLDELWTGARLAKNFGNHSLEDVVPGDHRIPPRGVLSESISDRELLWPRERAAFKIQQSRAFWREPKDLLVTLVRPQNIPQKKPNVILDSRQNRPEANIAVGWDQVANGNLGWPLALGLQVNPDGTGPDVWTFGAANAVTWFSAAVFGLFLVDLISIRIGRRSAVFFAAIFSFASVIGGSQARSPRGYIIWRLFLGFGIGAKASIVPIWESEILPQAKRGDDPNTRLSILQICLNRIEIGRLLVLWQVFVATGIFVGSVATYIFRSYWRNQVLTGAIPALILLILSYLGCESPRWLILRGKHIEAFDTLVRLRKERILAAEELIFIYFQIQTERSALLRRRELNFDELLERPRPYLLRVLKILTLPRNLRAALATMIVMLSQQLSGINILAFLASVFFNTPGFRKQPEKPSDPDAVVATNTANAYDSLRLAIGFGVVNAVASVIAYFLMEPNNPNIELQKYTPPRWMLGRRSLLLLSLAGGTVTLLVLALLLRLERENPAKLPAVMTFVILFTLCYSPGAGCVPFVYSAEVWPNEGREVGMSWAVFWNFFGAGILALLVPRGLEWGDSKLFGLFSGLSFLGFILVFLFVPATGPAMSLDDMSRKFETPTYSYSRKKVSEVIELVKWNERAPPPAASNSPPPDPGTSNTAIAQTETETPPNPAPPAAAPQHSIVDDTETPKRHKESPAAASQETPEIAPLPCKS